MGNMEATKENDDAIPIYTRPCTTQQFCCQASHPQDGLYAWLVCFCGLLCNIIAFGSVYSFGVVYPALLKEFGQSKATTALVGSLGMSFVYAFSPFAAKLYNHLGSRRLSVIGSVLCAVGLGCSSPAGTLSIMFFTHSVLTGLGACCIQTSVYMIVPRYFKKRATLALGIIVTGSGAGLLTCTSIVGKCLQTIGWRGAYLVMAGMAGFVCVLGTLFSPNIDNGRKQRTEENIASRALLIEHDGGFPVLWRNYVFLLIVGITTIAEISHAIVLIHLGNYSQDIGLTTDQSDTLYQLVGVFSMVSRVICGYLMDRSQAVTPIRAFRLCAFLLGISAVTCPFLSQFNTLVAYAVIFGFFYGSLNLAFYASVFSMVSLRQRSAAFGFSNLVTSLGYAAGPPFAGYLVDTYNSYPVVLYLAGGIELLALLMSYLVECFKPLSFTDHEPTSTTMVYYELLIVNEKLTVV